MPVAQNRNSDKAIIESLSLYNYSPALTPDKSKFALLIGISDYKEDQIEDLNGPVNSVFAFKELLIDKFQFRNEPQNIKILCNGKMTEKTKYDKDTACNESATAANIEKWFREILIKNARDNPNAIFVFQYVGHGSQVQDEMSGDEPDKIDETIVTWDSRDKEGKNFDLTDDKLFQLIQELAKITKNVLYLIDSCHSGTINRGVAKALEVPADTRPQSTPNSSSTKLTGDGQNQELLPANDRYVMITGAQSNGLAYEMEDKYYTALSYYLIQAMREAKPETSYQDLMNSVIRGVSQNNLNQRPQLIGDKLRSVLNGTAIDQDSYIRILPDGIKGNQMKIEAGATTGVKINNIVAVYDKSRLQLIGKDGRKAVGKVTKLNDTSATVTFIFEPGIKNLDERDKVVLLSPLFGSPQMKVGLVSLSETTAAPTNSGDILQKLIDHPLLKDSKLIKIENLANSDIDVIKSGKLPAKFANAEDLPTVLVRRGTFREAFIKRKPFIKIADEKSVAGVSYVTDNTSDDTEIFYITDSGGEPTFDFYVKTTDKDADEKIAKTLLKLARQRNLTALENKQSVLGNSLKTAGNQPVSVSKESILNKIELQFLKVEIGINEAGKKVVLSEKPVAPEELFLYDSYIVQIKNKSAQKLFVYLLNISTDGSISLMYPDWTNCPAAEAISPGVLAKMKARAFRLTPPFGFERFKLIVSASERPSSAICYLEQAAAKKNGLNPLEVLFDEVLTGTPRDGGTSDVDSWGTADLTIEIKPQP